MDEFDRKNNRVATQSSEDEFFEKSLLLFWVVAIDKASG